MVKRNMKKLLGIGLAFAMTCSMITGCGGGSSTTPTTAGSGETAAAGDTAAKATTTSDKTLRFACVSYAETLDPAAQTNSSWASIRYGIGECLFKFDDSMNVVNSLCDECTVNDAKTEWVFHIRDGVKFSNGNDLTATAVLKSLQSIYDKEKEGPEAGYSATPSTYIPAENIKSLTADDDKGTVTMTLTKAIADVDASLAYPFFVILDTTASENVADNPIGTGPYAVDKYEPGTSMSMVANQYYWDGASPYSKVEIRFIGDSSTKAMALESGDIDLAENIATVTDLQTLKDSSDYKVNEAVGVRCGFAYINQKGILANADLRKAILMSIDDDTICNVTVGGMYTAGSSVIPSNLDYGYDQLTDATPYNVEEAKKVLDDAGITDTDGDGYRELDGKNIDLKFLTYDSRCLKDLTQASATCIEAIGIKCTIEETTAEVEWNKLVAGEYDLLSNNWTTAATGNPYAYLTNWYSKSTANYCGFANDEYDKLYEELADELDSDKRKEIIQKLQQIIIDDAGVLVHGYYHSSMASNNTVADPVIHTADYYWITNEIKPAE